MATGIKKVAGLISGSTSNETYSLFERFSPSFKAPSYDSVSFSVSGQDSAPRGIAFNDDGTKMYMLGDNNNRIYQYSLSTAFDISTASVEAFFDVGLQNAFPTDIAFSNDGTKMFMLGDDAGDNRVYQYSLSTAFAINTASYTGTNFNVSIQDSDPKGIAFNDDGTKMYMVGTNDSIVYQYSLSTAFDISAVSYTGTNFSVEDQDSAPRDIAFSNDGTKMFMLGGVSRSVFRYSLSTAFDVSTASYTGANFSVDDQDGDPKGIAFNDDGTKMYMVGSNSESVYQYSLPTAFDVFTFFNVNAQDAAPTDIAFNNDGTKMFMLGGVSDRVYQYSLSTAFDISTASYTGANFSVASEDTTSTGISFSNDGTKMHLIGASIIRQYSLSTAFDISTASYDEIVFDGANDKDSNLTDIAFNNDGTKMFVIGTSTDSVYQYSLSTAFDISTASYDSVFFSVASQVTSPADIAFSNDGTKMYILADNINTVFQYSLSTAFDISTASYTGANFSFGGQDSASTSIAFNNDGTKMYMLGNITDGVYQYLAQTLLVEKETLYTAPADKAAKITAMIYSTKFVDVIVGGVKKSSAKQIEYDGSVHKIYGNSTDNHYYYETISPTTNDLDYYFLGPNETFEIQADSSDPLVTYELRIIEDNAG